MHGVFSLLCKTILKYACVIKMAGTQTVWEKCAQVVLDLYGTVCLRGVEWGFPLGLTELGTFYRKFKVCSQIITPKCESSSSESSRSVLEVNSLIMNY